ncbi:hypothetical protein C6P45_003440 [Maudiozyma exigua]|uniref:Condensin complex subunit 2 n=1 Tax=Maudiozyma exigua TaxID=34358 RepID=A0A9P6WDY7_MAUEX|nr:hypothetical protein C6P45_003440 [Kazachstania exigua]
MTTQLRLDNDDENDLFTNKTTMMANFEEWIKMATDNKINSSNSWNFALIDYFYDLNVLKDSENNINFQKASATLDGCVKIYSSRVDSVSNETGKLLSGLAQRKETTNKKKDRNADGTSTGGTEDNADGTNGTNGGTSNELEQDGVMIDPLTGLPVSVNNELGRRRVHNRVLETTLVDFDTIKMKALDQELNIDPLFKKALVDFDEGGAKSLLLNTLNLDDSLRVVFDASIKDDNTQLGEKVTNVNETRDSIIDQSGLEDSVLGNDKSRSMVGDETKDSTFVVEDEVLALGIDFIQFDKLSLNEISPSIQQLRNVVEDISKAKSFVKDVNSKLDNFLTEEEIKDTVPDAYEGADDNMDYYNDDNDIGKDDDNTRATNNSNVNMTPRRLDMSNMGMDGDDENNDSEDSANDSHNNTTQLVMEKDLMAYFDDNLNKNWRGREHWKVRSFKKKLLPELARHEAEQDEQNGDINGNTTNVDGTEPTNDEAETTTHQTNKNKKKEFQIDFFNLDDDLEETVFTHPKKKSAIEMTQRSRINDSHYLLPDDFHFSTEKITKLFIKPKQTMSLFSYTRRNKEKTNVSYVHPDTLASGIGLDGNDVEPVHTIADEEFWAETYKRKEEEEARANGTHDGSADIVGTQLENPFDDGDDNGIDFNQAFDDAEYNDDDHTPEQLAQEGHVKTNEDEFGVLPQKVAYSRVSKKVDVRRLKNNIWKSVVLLVNERDSKVVAEDHEIEIIKLSFKDIANELVNFYPKELLKDISTSFCFICLLHLSNEHGLTLENTENFEDLTVVYNKSTIQLSQ